MPRTDIAPRDPQHPERMAGAEVPARYARWPGLLSLTFALVGPPMALLYHELVQYALVPWACYAGRHWTFHAVFIGFALIAIVGGVLGWRDWQATGGGPSDDEGTVADRTRFIGVIATWGAAFMLLIIIGQWVATLFIDPCMRV